VQAFIKAVKASRGGKRKGAATGTSGGPRRKRAVITAATKAQVKALTQAGKTGAEIAKAAGISLPSVQNIKKALGLVKARK
jgi:DNA-binding CsgD family transcriptional regulator